MPKMGWGIGIASCASGAVGRNIRAIRSRFDGRQIMTRNYRIVFPILWAMLIYWLSSLPGNEANKILPEFWNSG